MSEKISFWRRLTAGLSRTASKLGDGITGLGRRRLDAATLESLEDLLIQADVGTATAARIVAAVGRQRPGSELDGNDIKALLAAEIEKIVAPVALPFAPDL